MPVVLIILAALIFIGLTGFRVAQQYERALVFRFGRYVDTRGPGLFWILPFGIDTTTKSTCACSPTVLKSRKP